MSSGNRYVRKSHTPRTTAIDPAGGRRPAARRGTGSRGAWGFVKAFLIVMLVGLLLALSAGLGLGVAAYQRWSGNLPSPDGLVNRQTFRTAQILDRNGQ